MAKRRAYSDDGLGPTMERLMTETGLTYRALADKTDLSAGYLNHIVHGNRPVPSNDVLARLAGAFGVKPEHFREYRIRVITDKLEQMPELVDRLYKSSAEAERAARSAGDPRRGPVSPPQRRRRSSRPVRVRGRRLSRRPRSSRRVRR